MARPIKVRIVEFFPEIEYFVPVGKCRGEVTEKRIKVEELEAMRLKDIKKLSQSECAKKMGISRQTFQNILESARKKVATALTEGYAINISGGHYTNRDSVFKCRKCKEEYKLKYEHEKHECPKCGSQKVYCKEKESRGRMICKNFCLNIVKKENKREE